MVERDPPKVDQAKLRELIYGNTRPPRFTQDSPILPSVWLEFGKAPNERVDLLLTPHREKRPAALAQAIRERLRESYDGEGSVAKSQLAFNDSYVVGKFTLHELFTVLLPLTNWFKEYLLPEKKKGQREARKQRSVQETVGTRQADIVAALEAEPGSEAQRRDAELPASLIWLVRIAGVLEMVRLGKDPYPGAARLLIPGQSEKVWEAFQSLLPPDVEPAEGTPPLWLLDVNRPARIAVSRSRQTAKADAAERTFQPDYKGIKWAIIDTGIDATHPAFRRRDKDDNIIGASALDITKDWAGNTRIVRSYDFTKLRPLLTESFDAPVMKGLTKASRDKLADMRTALENGRSIDWDLLSEFLEVPYDKNYKPPEIEHGTHVAGILAGDWRAQKEESPERDDLKGICPTLELFDLRVFDDGGNCDEFCVIGALQFIRFLNSRSDQPVIHGVNISMSIPADPTNYASGQTPVCEECERVVNNGVVVVVAAGNAAYDERLITQVGTGFQDITITDPGTAEAVITVGATHRVHPHTFGVSYFSSRGPTPDGRCKPDILAPGEKIVSAVPNGGSKALDGTSMAAPHVSGAAAMLLARNREFIGKPEKIKRILMDTATDLGRTRDFQGAGLLDILRALESV